MTYYQNHNISIRSDRYCEFERIIKTFIEARALLRDPAATIEMVAQDSER